MGFFDSIGSFFGNVKDFFVGVKDKVVNTITGVYDKACIKMQWITQRD